MNTNGMKCIGKGAFSTVYQQTKNTVLIKSRDNVKECMAHGFFPDSKLFPTLTHVGWSNCGEYQFYEEKFYSKTKGLKNHLSQFEYEFYMCLRNINPRLDGDGYHNLYKDFNALPNKFHSKKRTLVDALNGLSNYGNDICFEISPRNVAIRGKKLVLLDCFFFSSELKKVRSKKRY